jgi:hypothetical protein
MVGRMALRIALTTSLLVLASILVARLASNDVAAAAPGPVVVVLGAAADRAAVDQSLARFADNDLTLPDLEIRFSADEADCEGHLGLFLPRSPTWRVVVCSDLPFVVTHELAHAWEAANLSDDERDRYVGARGLTNWNDPGADWNDQGIEDAAFVIQQNLMADRPPVSSAAWQERTAAYELLTGAPSPLLLGEAPRPPAQPTHG